VHKLFKSLSSNRKIAQFFINGTVKYRNSLSFSDVHFSTFDRFRASSEAYDLRKFVYSLYSVVLRYFSYLKSTTEGPEGHSNCQKYIKIYSARKSTTAAYFLSDRIEMMTVAISKIY